MPLSLFGGIRPIDRRGVMRDVFAGMSLASINIPQVLGYARIAGMPVVTGLFTAFLPWSHLRIRLFPPFRRGGRLCDGSHRVEFAVAHGHAWERPLCSAGQYHRLLTAGLLLLARIFRLGVLADFLSRTCWWAF